MKNPERLVNNALLRGLVAQAGLLGAREIIRRSLLPLVVSPAKQRALRERVKQYLTAYFPEFDAAERERRANAYLYHFGCKFGEDCIVLNVPNVPAFIRLFNEHMVYRGAHYFREAVYRPGGVVVVGSHVGAVTLGTTGFFNLYFTVPEADYPKSRICAEPEVRRYPKVLTNLEQVIKEYHGDVEFIITHRDSRDIATEFTDVLSDGGLVTTNLDVLLGGSSQQPFSLFDGRARVYLPALMGAAKMALRSGATVLPWTNWRTRAGYRFVLEPPIGPVARLGDEAEEDHPAVLELCEQLRRILEGWIRAAPEQWVYWDRFHRRVIPREQEEGA
jgi:lauroyl/myristoyl acyltransferase